MFCIAGIKALLFSAVTAPVLRYYTNPAGVKFVYIGPGKFEMGNQHKPNECRPVKISGFWLSVTPVTNKQFEYLVPKHKRGKYTPRDSQPVTDVRYVDALRYAKLSQVKFGRHYRLPTAAEWEYAARGGRQDWDFPWGNSETDFPQMKDTTDLTPANVASFPPNAYGLYDLICEVEEWVLDDSFVLSINFENSKLVTNPLYLNQDRKTTDGMVKGSYWGNLDYVYGFAPGYRDITQEDCDFYGFRLVMTKVPTKFTKICFIYHPR